jgi:acetyl esterase
LSAALARSTDVLQSRCQIGFQQSAPKDATVTTVRVRRHMPVDPQLQAILVELNSRPPLREVPLELLRQGSPLPKEPARPLADVVNRSIQVSAGELPVRIYYPRIGSEMPVLVYYHGGGFVLGSLESHDALLRNMAAAVDCVIVSVDYRLAPEHRFPAAVDDALEAVKWVHANAGAIRVDPMRIAVGGDSAGGNLATVVALRIRDEGGPALRAQLLIYPVTHLRGPISGSMVTNGEGYFLQTIDMTWFADMYLGNTDAALHPHASPLLADDLRSLPRALVITAGFDPLLDQGRAYASRLSAAGNECAHIHYADAIHGFFGLPIEIGRRAVGEASSWLKAAYS